MSSGERLASLNMSDLADHLWLYQPKAGVRYVRTKERPAKHEARLRVAELADRHKRHGRYDSTFSVLTMPSLWWTFEKILLQKRETANGLKLGKCRRTAIYAVEHDEAIYRAALKHIPGNNLALVQLPTPPGATCCYRTALIRRYYRMDLADYADYVEVKGLPPVDLIWADFHGSMSANRLALLGRLWGHTRRYLSINAMRGRTHESISDAAREAGGIDELLTRAFRGSRVEHVIQYHDTTPMVQVTLEKVP